jgi:hypothetical protein
VDQHHAVARRGEPVGGQRPRYLVRHEVGVVISCDADDATADGEDCGDVETAKARRALAVPSSAVASAA